MATSNTYSLTSEHFKIPSEPCPLPSIGSDEESFVVLWKDEDKSLNEESFDSVHASVVEEAKELINKELSQLEQSQKATEKNLEAEKNDLQNTDSEPKMEQSSTLPNIPQVEKGFDTSEVISITTLSTDLTSEEVQGKISQIIEENIRLKDIILQNNMTIRSQYERIVAWQEDVQKVHQAHKDKIIEAKDFIERLKKDNYNLNHDLEKMRQIKNVQDDELNSLKQTLKEKEQKTNEKLVQSVDNNMKQFELDVANKKVKELELAIQNMTLENGNLKCNNNELLKDTTRVEEYEKEIEKLRELLHISKMQLEEAKMELLKVKSLEDEKQKSLNETIESLRSQLRLANQQHLVPLEEMANIRQQLTNTQIMLTQVEYSRTAAYSQIEPLNKEITELRQQLQDMQAQKDEIYALQTQLDVYKADFEAERNAKETIKEENNKFSEDVQNLQRRNQQLQEEIEILRVHRDFVVYPSRRTEAPSAPSPSSSESPPLRRYACPICNLQFRSLKLIEDHVETCVCHRD